MLKLYDERFPLPYGGKREEWAKHDSEHIPKRLYSESMDFNAVYKWLDAIADMDEERAQAYETFIENGDEPSEFNDRYAGRYGEGDHCDEKRVLADYAEVIFFEGHSEGDIPQELRSYIDWISLGRDYLLSGDVWVNNDHVFRS